MDKEVLEIIRYKYGLSYLLERDNLGGLSTLNLSIKANGEEFVLKQYQKKDINKIEEIEKITFFLKKNKLPIVIPKKTLKGNYHLEVDNLFFVLYPKVNGRILYENSLTERSLVNTANLLQNFHGLDIDCSLALKKNSLSLHEFLKNAQDCKKLILNNTLGAEIDDLIFLFIDKKITIIKKFIKNFLQKKMDQHDLVHGDFHNENILFDVNDKIVCLLDFEEVHHGCGVEDLMQFIQLACCNTGYQEENLIKAKLFLHAYSLKRFVNKETLTFYTVRYMHRVASSFFLKKNYI